MLETKSLRDLADEGYGKAGAALHHAADEIDSLRAELATAKGEWVEGPPKKSPAWVLLNGQVDPTWAVSNGAISMATHHMPITRPQPPESKSDD